MMTEQHVQLVANDAERWTVSRVFVPTLRHDIVPAQPHRIVVVVVVVVVVGIVIIIIIGSKSLYCKYSTGQKRFSCVRQ